MKRADRIVDRQFAEELPVVLVIGAEHRPIVSIYESPDDPRQIKGGGEINDQAPAISAYTADITGLSYRCQVIINNNDYWVTHIGADEVGRTRVTLARGQPGKSAPAIKKWS